MFPIKVQTLKHKIKIHKVKQYCSNLIRNIFKSAPICCTKNVNRPAPISALALGNLNLVLAKTSQCVEREVSVPTRFLSFFVQVF